MSYGRCADSEIYQNTPEAICRVEKGTDGKIYYQPYVEWERLSLPDEAGEEREIFVYQDDEWISKIINREEEDETGADEGGGAAGDTESGEGKDGGEVDSDESASGPEIRYVDRIVEVPVEKKVVEKVEVEVPMEKIVTEKVDTMK